MQKRQEMYDKLIKKIDENVAATAARITQVTKNYPSDGLSQHPTYAFVTELQTELVLWADIRKEIKSLKKQHIS